MIDEYERLNSASDVNKSSRLRLFLFPTKPESVSSIGSLLENSTKSEDWFLNALNGTTSGFSDTSSVNCLLGLDDDVPVLEKKDVDHKGVIGKNPKANNSAQDVHSVPDLERTSSFGSASSSPSLANLPPIRVHVDDNQKVGGIEEQFSQMSVQQQHQKVQHDGGFVAAPAPVVVAGVPASSTPVTAEYTNREQPAFDLVSTDSASSDGRQKPPMIYQDQLLNIQSSNNNNLQIQLPGKMVVWLFPLEFRMWMSLNQQDVYFDLIYCRMLMSKYGFCRGRVAEMEGCECLCENMGSTGEELKKWRDVKISLRKIQQSVYSVAEMWFKQYS